MIKELVSECIELMNTRRKIGKKELVNTNAVLIRSSNKERVGKINKLI